MPKLTDISIRAIRAEDRDQWIKDSAAPNLYLRVRTTGSKVFALRLKRGGKVHVRTLGAWPDCRLADARSEAARASARKRGRIVRTSVRDALDAFWRQHIEPRYKRTASAAVYRRVLEQYIGTRPVEDVHPSEISEITRLHARKGPVAANRLLSFSGLFFKWCIESGYAETNPCASLTRRAAGGDERSRERTLTHDEIKWLWASEDPHANLLRALLLTGCRIGELQTAKRANLKGERLAIPENKSSRPHWVHVTPMLREQFDGAGQALFSQRSTTATQAWLRRKHGEAPNRWTPHDLRRTFATLAGEIGTPPHIIRKLLNHAEEGTLLVYMRAEFEQERVQATDAIAARIAKILEAHEVTVRRDISAGNPVPEEAAPQKDSASAPGNPARHPGGRGDALLTIQAAALACKLVEECGVKSVLAAQIAAFDSMQHFFGTRTGLTLEALQTRYRLLRRLPTRASLPLRGKFWMVAPIKQELIDYAIARLPERTKRASKRRG